MGLINKVAKKMTILLTGAMIGVIAVDVFSRYVLGNSVAWAEEFSRYALVWIVFVGGIVAVHERQLIAFDFFVKKIPQPLRYRVQFGGYILSCLFLLVAAYYGVLLTANTYLQASPALRFPMSYAYVVIPIGCSFMFLCLIRQGLEIFMKKGGDSQDSK